MYTDPSGETGVCNCPEDNNNNSGFSNTEQSATGNIIVSLANFFSNPRNTAWIRNNANSAWRDIKDGASSAGKFVSRNIKSVGNDISKAFSKLFGGSKSSSGGSVQTVEPFPQDGSSSWTGGSGGAFGGGENRLFGLIQNANVNSQGQSPLEEHREKRGNPGYNPGENKWDRIFRLIGNSHYEIAFDYGSGGYNMFGGYGRALKTATSVAAKGGSLGSLKNISGGLDDAANLARNQPYGATGNNIFRRLPQSAQDVQALTEAQAGMGRNLNLKLNDPRYLGWEKWHHSVGPRGSKSVVHYLRNPKTGFLTDFKFK